MFVSYVVVIDPFIGKCLVTVQALKFFTFSMFCEQVWQILAIVICSKCAAFIFAGFPSFPFMCSSYVTHFGPFPQEGFGTPRAVVNTILIFVNTWSSMSFFLCSVWEQPGKVHLIHLFLGNSCDCACLDNSLLFNLFLPVGLPWLNPLLIVISWLEGIGLEVGTGSTSLSLEMAIGMELLCPAIRGREGRGGGENSLEALVMLLVVEVAVVDVAAALVITSMSGSLGNSGWVPKVFRVPLWGLGGFVSS